MHLQGATGGLGLKSIYNCVIHLTQIRYSCTVALRARMKPNGNIGWLWSAFMYPMLAAHRNNMWPTSQEA